MILVMPSIFSVLSKLIYKQVFKEKLKRLRGYVQCMTVIFIFIIFFGGKCVLVI